MPFKRINVEIGTFHDDTNLHLEEFKIAKVGEIETWISWGIIKRAQLFSDEANEPQIFGRIL